jgi:ferric-dicitrate binding protein FerR (iron transport regulator)
VYFNAASLLLAGIAGTWIARSHNRNTTAAASTEPGEYRTSRGQYATIRLADSTAVTLAPESHLTVSARFADGVREISLEGEAIFNVRHDALHPFRVRTHGALVEDVGTRFDLRAYPDDAEVTVAVAEGSVSLGVDSAAAPATPAHRSPATVVLRGGDVGMLGTQGTVASEHSPSVAGYLGWADGRLSFVDRPLPEVLRTIARWYDLDLRVDDAQLARRLVTADFVRQSASQMIDALAVAMDATVERRGRIVTLRPR